MKNCANCGLGVEDIVEGKVRCFKYNTVSNPVDDRESCVYYIGIIVEDEEPLPPLQHLLLKEEELKARKMKGVV